jgi:spore coat protein U-like protein
VSSRFKPGPVARLASFVFASVLSFGACAGTGTVTAQASVNTLCTVATTALNFGPYDPLVVNTTANLDNGTSASVSISCVKGSPATIALGNGAHFSGTNRRMQNASKPTVLLTYELYQPPTNAANAACAFPGTTVWNGVNVLAPVSAPDKNSRTFNVCGTVPAGQDVEAGTYSDTVVVTVSF